MKKIIVTYLGLLVCAVASAPVYAADSTVSTVELETLSPDAYQHLQNPRAALKAISPVVEQALQKIELAQGNVIPDAKIADTLKSRAFAEQYNIALREFCAAHDNDKSLACMHESASGRMDKFKNY